MEARPPLPARLGKARLRHHASQPANMHSATRRTPLPQLYNNPRPTPLPSQAHFLPRKPQNLALPGFPLSPPTARPAGSERVRRKPPKTP